MTIRRMKEDDLVDYGSVTWTYFFRFSLLQYLTTIVTRGPTLYGPIVDIGQFAWMVSVIAMANSWLPKMESQLTTCRKI